MTGTKHVEIAGGGFAGLATATAFRQRGWTARIHEAAPELRSFGAGIFIWENGLRVLKALGAYDAVIGSKKQRGSTSNHSTGGVSRSRRGAHAP